MKQTLDAKQGQLGMPDAVAVARTAVVVLIAIGMSMATGCRGGLFGNKCNSSCPPGYSPACQPQYGNGGYPAGTVPPGGTYPPGTYPPGTYPPGTYPPGTYPPGTYAPGTYAPASQSVTPPGGTYAPPNSVPNSLSNNYPPVAPPYNATAGGPMTWNGSAWVVSAPPVQRVVLAESTVYPSHLSLAGAPPTQVAAQPTPVNGTSVNPTPGGGPAAQSASSSSIPGTFSPVGPGPVTNRPVVPASNGSNSFSPPGSVSPAGTSPPVYPAGGSPSGGSTNSPAQAIYPPVNPTNTNPPGI